MQEIKIEENAYFVSGKSLSKEPQYEMAGESWPCVCACWCSGGDCYCGCQCATH